MLTMMMTTMLMMVTTTMMMTKTALKWMSSWCINNVVLAR